MRSSEASHSHRELASNSHSEPNLMDARLLAAGNTSNKALFSSLKKSGHYSTFIYNNYSNIDALKDSSLKLQLNYIFNYYFYFYLISYTIDLM